MRIFVTTILVGLIALAICACAAQGAKVDDKTIPKLTYCELIKHSEKYDDKVVEVTAIYGNGFEKSYLYDKEDCKNGLSQSQTWVAYDKSFVMEGDSEEAKTNNKISGFGVWEVTAIGRFKRAKGPQRYGHLGCCQYEFDFMKILQAEKISDRAR